MENLRPNNNFALQLLDVSVVVCCKNAADTIADCLKSIKANNPKEIILVDGKSIDKTTELAKPYVTKIFEDPGKSLAMARNYGLKYASSKYICNVGPDNILFPDTLKTCIEYLEKNNYVGVSTQTYIKKTDKSYLSWAMNLYKKARYFPTVKIIFHFLFFNASDIFEGIIFLIKSGSLAFG